MTGRLLLTAGILIYIGAYCIYGQFLERVFDVKAGRPTPAHRHRDNVDFIPARMPVVFGHHFASIAGAGPIIGPVLAIAFGWGPVFLWLLLGCILIGTVHDFCALMISLRHEGQSIGHIVEHYLSYPGRQIFLIFCCAALVLIVAIFSLLIAKTFLTTPAVATSSLLFIICALIFGVMTHSGLLNLRLGTIIFVPLIFLSVGLGSALPLDLMQITGLTMNSVRVLWLIILFGYIFAASVLPVWILLQPRDYLNSFLLYAMMLLGLVSIMVVAPPIRIPFFEGFHVTPATQTTGQWSLFPILFVIVACGACSGFHSLVASGTTSKQIDQETDARPVAYGAMLLEGILGMITLISVSVLTQADYGTILKTDGPVNLFAQGLARLGSGIGLPASLGETFISLTISAFMLTTLDTATRLTRLTIHELVLPPHGSKPRRPYLFKTVFENRYSATGLVVILAGYLALSGDAGRIWPVFGAANQLLAALTLLVLTVVFRAQAKNIFIVGIPFLIMLGVAGWALADLFFTHWHSGQWPLCFISGFLFLMAVVMTGHAILEFQSSKKRGTHGSGL